MDRDLVRRTSDEATWVASGARVNTRPPANPSGRLSLSYAALKHSVWSRVLGKAAGIACGMLALATIGALATARGLGGRQVPIAEPSTSSRAFSTASGEPQSAPVRAREASLSAPLASAAAGQEGAPQAPSAGIAPDGKVILNLAALEDLRRLPGVGPKRAQAILALREKLGRFRRSTDLLRIKGIGVKSLKKLEAHFVLDPPAPKPEPGGSAKPPKSEPPKGEPPKGEPPKSEPPKSEPPKTDPPPATHGKVPPS
jgi:competence protein ComEA